MATAEPKEQIIRSLRRIHEAFAMVSNGAVVHGDDSGKLRVERVSRKCFSILDQDQENSGSFGYHRPRLQLVEKNQGK